MKGTCDCCKSEDIGLKSYARSDADPLGPRLTKRLCYICSNTPVNYYREIIEKGTPVLTGQKEPNLVDVMKMIAFVGNTVMKAIGQEQRCPNCGIPFNGKECSQCDHVDEEYSKERCRCNSCIDDRNSQD